jgi:hypothetical protein
MTRTKRSEVSTAGREVSVVWGMVLGAVGALSDASPFADGVPVRPGRAKNLDISGKSLMKKPVCSAATGSPGTLR